MGGPRLMPRNEKLFLLLFHNHFATLLDDRGSRVVEQIAGDDSRMREPLGSDLSCPIVAHQTGFDANVRRAADRYAAASVPSTNQTSQPSGKDSIMSVDAVQLEALDC